jgi:hypothetical protein
LRQILAQPFALLVTQGAEFVVVVSAERGLTVADEVDVSHAPILSKTPALRLSQQ